jgi:hypothetical protein
MNIDTIIADTLIDLNARLWVINTRLFSGRIFRNNVNENGIIPTVTTSDDKYIEVLKDKKYDAQCFFDVLPEGQMIGAMEKNTVRAMFMVNLTKLYPTSTRTEATELAKKEAFNLLSCNFDLVSSGISGRTAFDDYYFEGKDIADMSPHFLFRYDCISFNTNC